MDINNLKKNVTLFIFIFFEHHNCFEKDKKNPQEPIQIENQAIKFLLTESKSYPPLSDFAKENLLRFYKTEKENEKYKSEEDFFDELFVTYYSMQNIQSIIKDFSDFPKRYSESNFASMNGKDPNKEINKIKFLYKSIKNSYLFQAIIHDSLSVSLMQSIEICLNHGTHAIKKLFTFLNDINPSYTKLASSIYIENTQNNFFEYSNKVDAILIEIFEKLNDDSLLYNKNLILNRMKKNKKNPSKWHSFIEKTNTQDNNLILYHSAKNMGQKN